MNKKDKSILLLLVKQDGDCMGWIECQHCPLSYVFNCYDLPEGNVNTLIASAAKRLLLIHDPSSLFEMML